jgi:hypothetical protein
MNVIFLFWSLFLLAIALYFLKYKNTQPNSQIQPIFNEDSDLLEIIEDQHH